MQRALSFDQNPPLALPMRYFLSAPLFAALAAALLLWQGDAALASRWTPATLAITHLLTLGCLSMTMVGALLQMLPVVAGVGLPHARPVAVVVHVALCAGTLLLACAFWLEAPALFQLALAALLTALCLLLVACTIGLWQQHASGATATVAAIRLSLAALAITIVLGGLLAGALAFPELLSLPLPVLTDVHAMWGLFGWVGLLVVGVAFQVVPMFQVTEPYPQWLTRSFTTILFLLLLASSIGASLQQPQDRWFHAATQSAIVAGYGLFAAITLALLARRKRPKADPTTLFWRTAMASLLAALLLWLLPVAAGDAAHPLALGVLFIAGFALTTINGMLYKIVPFLTWYHLQEAIGRGAPNVNKIIPERHARLQFALHLAALLLLLAACYWPQQLARPAGAAMCASCLFLWINLLQVMRMYRRLQRQAQTGKQLAPA
ncbi:permease [Duganella sp. FT3S]|uniref:Permease n=1 Tax=Rugamonas fusca TaxID=2758568 RepID=A0A7W2EIM8_9BURK|nr:permease [Rugamonas fusca]MBA5606637.1 permease [Rugamonas fusca]